MSLLDPLRNYCERTGPELWSEPLNAVSNLVFFIAAWALYKTYRARGMHDRPMAILIALLALVGCGSTLFHTFANQLTMIGDVVPIALFTFYYLWIALQRFFGFSIIKSVAGLIVFAGVASQMSNVPAAYQFNGSVPYFPCLAVLLLMGGVLYARRHPAGATMVAAALCFAVSLILRSIDFAVCAAFPIGTHFLWHILNGTMLYLLVRAMFKTPPTKIN